MQSYHRVISGTAQRKDCTAEQEIFVNEKFRQKQPFGQFVWNLFSSKFVSVVAPSLLFKFGRRSFAFRLSSHS